MASIWSVDVANCHAHCPLCRGRVHPIVTRTIQCAKETAPKASINAIGLKAGLKTLFSRGRSMKPSIFLSLLISICLLPCADAFGQSDEKKACAFNPVGMWRSEVTSETNPVFY